MKCSYRVLKPAPNACSYRGNSKCLIPFADFQKDGRVVRGDRNKATTSRTLAQVCVTHLLVVCLALWTLCNLRICSWPSSSFYVSFSISFGLVATSLCQASQRTTHSLRNLQNACSLQTGQGDGYWVVAFNSLLCTLRLTLICIVPISDSCFYYLSEDLNVRTLFLLNG